MWLAVAGSDEGGLAQDELAALLDDPDAQLAAKIASREQLAAMTKLSLPGDPLVQDAIEWGKQNLADSTQSAEDLQIRWTDQESSSRNPRYSATGSLVRRRLPRLPVDIRHRR